MRIRGSPGAWCSSPPLPATRSTCGRASVRRKLPLAALLVLFAASPGAAQPAPSPWPSYRIDPLPRTPADLAARFTPAQIEILEMLNRRDRAHLARTDPPTPGLVVPEEWSQDPLAYSPFPGEWPAAAAYPKAILVRSADPGVCRVRERTAGALGTGEHRAQGHADA